MFDKLWEILHQIWTHLIPFFIIEEYERGVRLRLGKLVHDNLTPGFHWKIPLADKVLSSIVTTDTLNINNVNITTLDNKTIAVGAVLEFEVVNIKKFIIDINEARTNAHDICRGLMADYLSDCTYAECTDKKSIKVITKLLTKKCEEMGIKVLSLTFTDIVMSRVIKLFGDLN